MIAVGLLSGILALEFLPDEMSLETAPSFSVRFNGIETLNAHHPTTPLSQATATLNFWPRNWVLRGFRRFSLT